VIVACRSCDLEFAEPFVAAPLDYYQANYMDYVAPSYEEIHPGYQFTIRKIRQAVAHLTPDANRAIDVGCGAGYLLVDLQRRGFECLGIDFNEDLVRVANERFGVPARVDDVRNLAKIGARFDVALLSHVLEHVDDPLGLLRHIHQILSPGGLLVIEIPNRNWYSVGHSLRNGTCTWNNYPPHHITFWSTASLRKALTHAGFSVVECIPRPFEDMGRIDRFVTGRLGLSKGPLYSFVSSILSLVGRAAKLEGSTLHAIARSQS
jgi:2-polyprenyl-3-methyl-5-hydroxy-6-metoxy-1,4-benzoquinol methylase